MNEEEKIKILRRLFNEVDPVGIFFDENIDEYDLEIKELLSLSPDYSNPDDLDKKLKDIFVRYFEGLQIDANSLSKLAKRIGAELQDKKVINQNY